MGDFDNNNDHTKEEGAPSKAAVASFPNRHRLPPQFIITRAKSKAPDKLPREPSTSTTAHKRTWLSQALHPVGRVTLSMSNWAIAAFSLSPKEATPPTTTGLSDALTDDDDEVGEEVPSSA